MGRPNRVDVAGYVYHLLNRAVGRYPIYRKEKDYLAYERVLEESIVRSDGAVQLLAYCVMPNHWHLVVRTRADGALGQFAQWLTLTHTQRFRVSHRNVGYDPVYQGRYKSFVLEGESYFLTCCRYVERNAVRAGLVERAEQWRWGSLWRWKFGDAASNAVLSPWPIPGGRPKHWLRTVNTPLREAELEAMRVATNRCQPYGSQRWREHMIEQFGLVSTVRRAGRPQKTPHLTD